MAFIRETNAATRVFATFPKKASTEFACNSAVAFSGGEVQPAVSTDTRLAGIIQQKISSTDSDYASETDVTVELIDPTAFYLCDVTTGTLTTESVGVQYDLDSSVGINVNSTSHKQVTCVAYISATQGLFVFNAAFQFANAV